MKALKQYRTVVTVGLILLAVVAGWAHVRASALDAIRVLGFEAPIDWTAEGGQIVGSNATRTQGNASLEVSAPGYTVVRSRLIGPLGTVSPTISFDLRVPSPQPNPSWFGAAQVFVSIPSLNMNNAYVGQRELTGLPLGQFVTLGYTVPSDILAKLRGTYFDLTVSIVLNVPAGVTGTYLIDNLQVSSTIPDDSTISEPDLPRILGLEEPTDWSITGGTIVGSSFTNSTQGNASLVVQPAGYATLTSLPMTSIGPVNPKITLDIRLPAQQPNPNWFGAVQLFATLPSANIYNAFIGQVELTGLAVETFHTLEFTPNESLRNTLNGTTYSDLRFSIALNAPTPGAGVYYIDNIQVGPVTNPSQDTLSNLRTDLIGRTSSGSVSMTIEGESGSPNVQDALFYIRADDGNCVPSELQACRFLVTQIRAKLGAFEIDGEGIAGSVVRNVAPFRLTVGGTHGLNPKIPSSAKFFVQAGNTLILASPRNVRMTINPAGDGFISVSGSLSGSFDGNSVSISMSLTANTPLLNRMPAANAGPDQTVTVGSGCVAVATLNGSATVDPDGNLARVAWFRNGTIMEGVGATVQVQLNQAGTHIYTALAEDSFGAQSRDDTVVTVQLPSGCP
jgi:hypothetical protein